VSDRFLERLDDLVNAFERIAAALERIAVYMERRL
jgi:hypothetical protein